MRSVKILLVLGAVFIGVTLSAQPDRWQQRVQYKMDVDFDASSHQYQGNQHLTYFNNSPDTLYKVFYHLYFNAFQPGSMMDVRSRTISDPDRRVRDRIFNLKPDEIGFMKVHSLKQNGSPVSFETVETILEVSLAKPILPGQKAIFEMEFQGQVPIQIRRSGRNNREGIAYSMAQWYPKMCEYDYQGWHANPYIAREFYGVWGDFEVAIHLDKKYVIGATGYLQNPEAVGHGYESAGMKMKLPKGDKLTWRFYAPNVHDFVWAADPEYSHTTLVRKDGLALHFFFQKNEKTEKTWAALPGIMDRVFDYVNQRFGQYQFKKYSFIQGGDGGMEYPMATLILGEGTLSGLVGVSVHELMHSWYQMMLGTNESLYSWMDEGFTDYATDEIMNFLKKEGLIPGEVEAFPWSGNYSAYVALAKSGLEEPLTTHADHFNTNRAYGTGSYSKGSVFLKQLEYVVGKQAFEQGLLKYFYTWKMKHPNANDFIRIMEKASGLELDWYKEYFVHTTATIDYGVKSVEESGGKTLVTLERAGRMPMPLDVVITYSDGSKEVVNIPMQIMRGNKPQEEAGVTFRVAADWPWVNPVYSLALPVVKSQIARIEIDPSLRMADINRANNLFE
ncbi:MAG: M1 family metallopeptidase [Haliscomenobacter sp.]|nr:M1 family metallopeptidase [Haliscomenobacter sp.]